MEPQEEVPSLRQAVRQFGRLVRLIRPYWKPLAQGMMLALVLGLVGMVTPYLTKLLIDEVYPTEDVSLMHVLVGGIVALGLSSTLLGTLRGYFTLYIDTRLNNATRLMFFNHLQHLTVRFFDQHQVGEINSRFMDVGRALESISRVFQTIFVQGAYLFLVPPVLFWLEWRLALVAIIGLPLTLSVTALSGRIMRKYWKRTSESFADLNAFQIETLTQIRTFKTMGLEHQVYRRAHGLIEKAMEQQLTAGGLAQVFGTFNGVLQMLNTGLFTWFGWTLILEREMTLGDFMAFTAYIGFLYNPLNQMIQLFSDFQQSAVSLNRMFEYLDEDVEQRPETAYTEPPPIGHPLRGEFRCEQLRFFYSEDRPVLPGLDLTLPAGSVTAIIGPSGSGKTTLLRLLSALERPTSGRLSIDGIPLDQIPLSDLRQQLAVVWQDVGLVRGTLWENLTLGSDSSTKEEVDHMVKVCGLEQLLAEMPEGYETAVAEWGTTLSSGQRQRVALARALLRGSPILLLDEATANIDVETEMAILRGILEQRGQTTLIFVTHRLATAALADQICVLEHGQLQGFGQHRELLETCPAYQRMVGASAGPTEASAHLRVVEAASEDDLSSGTP